MIFKIIESLKFDTDHENPGQRREAVDGSLKIFGGWLMYNLGLQVLRYPFSTIAKDS